MVARIITLLLTTIYLLLTPITIFAQSATPSSNLQLPTSIPPTSPLYTDLLVHNIFHTFSCLAVGQSVIGQPCLTYQFQKNAQGAIQGVPVLSSANLAGGTLGAVTGLIAGLYQNPPVRTSEYLGSLGEQLGIVKEAHAQGVVGSGAAVLHPIQTLWQVSRNISYVIMIVIFVVIGLMIIFRQRINPQTVITAQAALPGLVIGLILITFSYFLAALITDTAFIGTNIVGAYFSAAQNSPPPSNLSQTLEKENILSIMSTFVGATGQGELHAAVSNIISQLGAGPSLIIKTFASFLAYQYAYQLAEAPATVITGAACLVAGAAGLLNPVSDLTGTSATTTALIPNCIHSATLVGRTAAATLAAVTAFFSPATAISWALYVLLIAILIYTMFKLLFRLVNNFLAIIFYTVTAPFHFLAASLPGRQGITTGWILNMLSNVLAFPAIIAVFYFVNFLLGSGAAGVLTGKPPFPVTGGPLDLTSKGSLPLFGGMGTDFIRLILAYGTLLATPAIPDIISRAVGRVSQAGQLIGQEVRGGYGAGQQYVGRYGQSAQGLGEAIGGKRQLTYVPGEGYQNLQVTPGIRGTILGGYRKIFPKKGEIGGRE